MASLKTSLSIQPNTAVKIRAGVTTGDSSPYTDAAYDVSKAGVAQPQGYKSVLIFLRFTGGATPSAIVQLLHRVSQGNVAGGSGWVLGVQSTPLFEGASFFCDVMGRDFFPLISGITGAPSSVDIWAGGWEAYRNDGTRGG